MMRQTMKVILMSVSCSFFASYWFWEIYSYDWLRRQEHYFQEQFDNKQYKTYVRASAQTSHSDISNVIKRISKSIYKIEATHNSSNLDNKVSSFGSAVMISSDGYLVTNYHVINHAKYIKVVDENGRVFLAQVIGTDFQTDLALLKIEGDQYIYINYGNSDDILIGQGIWTLGYPYRLNLTLTSGIISSVNNFVPELSNGVIQSFIQFDANIQKGNSGGALIDHQGMLLGINTAILHGDGSAFGFAIPAKKVEKIINDLMEYGHVQRGKLGISVSNNESINNGIKIETILDNSPAQKCKLRKNDNLVALNNKKITSVDQFNEIMELYRPADKVNLDIIRDNKSINFKTILVNYLNKPEFIRQSQHSDLKLMGIEVRELNIEEQRNFKTNGLYVVSIDQQSKADKANMEPGYIIESVNGSKVRKIDDLIIQVSKLSTEINFVDFIIIILENFLIKSIN